MSNFFSAFYQQIIFFVESFQNEALLFVVFAVFMSLPFFRSCKKENQAAGIGSPGQDLRL
jgi:hypothetical protein